MNVYRPEFIFTNQLVILIISIEYDNKLIERQIRRKKEITQYLKSSFSDTVDFVVLQFHSFNPLQKMKRRVR